VGASDIELAIREGFESIEHIKRYTAMGFGTDQGKLGNINGMALAARAMGEPSTRWAPPPSGPTTCPSALAPLRVWSVANCLTRRAKPARTNCMWPLARCSKT